MMREPNVTVVKASIQLWIGTFMLIKFYGLATALSSPRLTYAALVCSALFAAYGVGFGIWAGKKLSRLQ